MPSTTCTPLRLLLLLALSSVSPAAENESDVLIFKNGEKLIGHLRRADAAKVVFVSDSAGPVTVEWSKIQELHSNSRFVALPKGVIVHGRPDTDKIAKGAVAVKEDKLEITPAPAASPQTIPVAEVATVLPEPAFNAAFAPHSFWTGWTGMASLSGSILRATQDTSGVSSLVSLERSNPGVPWLPKHSRTSINFNSSYSLATSSSSAPVKSNVIHGDAEQDFFLSPKLYLLVGAMFDHNYLQGLDLSQGYGGGLGIVAASGEKDHLEFRFGGGYTDQHWTDSTLNHKFFGARVGVSYAHTFQHGVVASLDAGVRPAISYPKALFGGYIASLTVPVYRRFALNLNSFDNFVNNPPPFFKKNVFQVAFGVSYVIK